MCGVVCIKAKVFDQKFGKQDTPTNLSIYENQSKQNILFRANDVIGTTQTFTISKELNH